MMARMKTAMRNCRAHPDPQEVGKVTFAYGMSD